MKKITSADVHNFLKAVILLGFVILIMYLLLSGDVLLYITPSLTIYLKLAAAGLIFVTIFQFYISIVSLKKPISCNCGHDHDSEDEHSHDHSHEPSPSLWKNVVIYGLFFLPLVFGAIIPNTALAGTLAQNRGMNLGGLAVDPNTAPADLIEIEGNESPELKQLFKTSVYNRDYARLGMKLYQQESIEMQDEWFIEKLQALNDFPDAFAGKQIKITGFVYREDGLPDSQFIVGRMAMTHCIADISPYGIIAETPDSSQYANDSWVTVTGSIGKAKYHGLDVIKINIEKIEPATAAKVPYIYPDWNFASKL